MAERVSSGIELVERGQCQLVDRRSVLMSDDVRTLQSMLQNSQVAVDDQDEFQATLLHIACEYHCLKCIDLLLGHPHNAALKVYDVNGFTPIHTAAHSNQAEIINILYNRDQTLIDCLSTYNETPLMIGCLAGHIKVVECLFHLGANLHITNAEGSTLLHYAASKGVPEVLEFMLQLEGMKNNVNSQNNRGDTPAHNAMRHGCAECVEVLCRHGAEFDIRNRYNMSPVDVASALGNEKCLTIFNNFTKAGDQKTHRGGHKTVPKAPAKNASPAYKAGHGMPQEPRKSQTKFPLPPQHGEDNCESSEDSSQEEHDGSATSGLPSRATSQSLRVCPSHRRLSNGDNSAGRERVQSLPRSLGTAPSQASGFPPTQPMKKKTQALKHTAPDNSHGLQRAHSEKYVQKEGRRKKSDRPKTDPARKRSVGTKGKGNKESAAIAGDTTSSESTSPQSVMPNTCEEPQIKECKMKCPQCGRLMYERTTVIEGASGITTFDAHMNEARTVKQTSPFCLMCDRNWSHRHLSSKPDSNLYSSKDRQSAQEQVANPQLHQQHSQEQQDSGVFSSMSSSITESNGVPPGRHQARNIVISTQPKDVKGRYGEEVVLECHAFTTKKSDLSYQWNWKKGGKSTKIKGAKSPELRQRVDMRKQSVVYCRVSLANNKDIFLYSNDVRITPMFVWFTEKLQPVDGYLGEKAELICKADTAQGIRDPIKYVWLKRVSKESKLEYYAESDDGKLTFDPLTHENEGYYVCQADITSQYVESEAVYVKAKIRPKRSAGLLQVTKEPRSYAVTEGGQLSLSCEAKQTAGSEGPLHYQWYHNGTAIAGATAASYKKGVQRSDVGNYCCQITSKCGQSVTTEEVEVALAHPRTARVDRAGKSPIQGDQNEARRPLKTLEERRFAREKVALLIGNQCYDADSLPNLSTPENDVKNLADTLTDIGFKVFSLVNLRYNEMMTALQNFYDLLVPGVYAIFAYTGHGCTYQNINYLIPVDAHGPDPIQCISSAVISNNLQQQLCRVFKFIDCCRVKSTAETTHCPNNSRKYNFANLVEIASCAADQKSYESRSQSCSNFNRALTEAIRHGGNFMDVFHKIGELMARNHESTPGATYAEPTISELSAMDREISFHDKVMLDDPQYEEKLDRLLTTWERVHPPPMSVKIQLGEVLSRFLNVAELEFECEFSNVLEVKMKWQVCSTTCSSCSVAMTSEDQDVEIETTALPPAGARFRIISLQRLKAGLKLHLTFTITSMDGRESKYTVLHDLQCRPLYAQLV